ncbi:RtcB family protein [Roseibacillus persicicus]|uniref:RtcB family protein n=1 Tax=Roseibacillus persicicus TaxID=454148 RepID=UPI0028107791|nr:RtcB family protein [Roseibacillus persicicus]MDQ8192647.1 RtcB family protein [Roseibacillus persicicus]
MKTKPLDPMNNISQPLSSPATPRKGSGIKIHHTDEAIGFIPLPNNSGKPITVIGNDAIRNSFDDTCLQQIVNSRMSPGVTEVILNPDGHAGYGAPIGCVMVSPTHIYPGPVGVDIKCSMSLLQTDIPEEAVADKSVRRALINAITERTPTGAGRGTRSVKKGRKFTKELGIQVVTEGASPAVCEALGIPVEWAERCEDSAHLGHDGTVESLRKRLDFILETKRVKNFGDKIGQLGSYGGGNHFGECEITRILDLPSAKETAEVFGLKDGHVSFLSHCGSRGFGNILACAQFKDLETMFEKWGIPYPAGDKKLVYAPLGTPEANAYLDDMALGANFATVNHLLINALVLEAFQEVLPGTTGKLVYFISHNIAREEIVEGRKAWVHRKGATRAVPGGHFSLAGTPFAETGHPILLPGNPRDGSVVMVAQGGAERTAWSVNHGAGRQMGRKHAARTLDQAAVDAEFDSANILYNSRKYPIDESPDAYKNFADVLNSVEAAGLAKTVAKLEARFVIKDSAEADD